jgi:hypothetical protein
MASPEYDSTNSRPVPETRRASAHPLWYVAMAIALVAIVGLFVSERRLSGSLTDLRQSSQAQIAKLNDDLAQKSTEIGQRADTVAQEARESAKAVEQSATSAMRRSSAAFAAKLADQSKAQEDAHQAVVGELTDLKQATDNKFSDISTDVGTVKTDVGSVKSDLASTQSEVQQHGTELKRMTGDLGVVSDHIATNQKELGELRALGERNYMEFDITKKTGMKRIGNIELAVAKADPKRSRFTLNVQADDKLVSKRDRTINEPVQLYVSGARQPYEIVVNSVKKDEVIGYVAIPKVTAQRTGPSDNLQ